MRIAAFSDIHGNDIALDAVLRDIERRGGVDAYWAIGDLVANGPGPVGVLDRLTTLPNCICTRGNTDRYIFDVSWPSPTINETIAEPTLAPKLAEVSNQFAWTHGALSATGWMDWLAALPLAYRAIMPDGTRVLAVHGAPGDDSGSGFKPIHSDDEFREKLAGCEADLVITGHTHWPLDRTVDGVRVVNVSSVSLPSQPDLRASYAIFDFNADGYTVTFHRAEYDHQAVIDLLERLNHPARDYIITFMRGAWRREWADRASLPELDRPS